MGGNVRVIGTDLELVMETRSISPNQKGQVTPLSTQFVIDRLKNVKTIFMCDLK